MIQRFFIRILFLFVITGLNLTNRPATGQSTLEWIFPDSSAAETHSSNSPDIDSPQTSMARPLPPPVTLPPAFQNAIHKGTRTTTGVPGPDYWQQEADYTLTARLHPDQQRLEGDARIVYTNRSPDTLQSIHFELAQNFHSEGTVRNEQAEITGGMELQKVHINGKPYPERRFGGSNYFVHGTQLVILPEKAVGPNESVEIEIDWSFDIPRSGAGGRMGYSEDNLLFLAYWYPILSVYDDVEGWHTDPFLGQAEFYSGFADYEVTIELPENWIVMATGELTNTFEVLTPEIHERLQKAYGSDEPVRVVDPHDFITGVTRTTPNGRTNWHFSAEKVRDFTFSATRNMFWDAARTEVDDRDLDGEVDYVHINTIYRERAPLWKHVTAYQQQSIQFLSDFTGYTYPWPHMTTVEGGGIIGGGMEYPMMTLIGDYSTAGEEALFAVTVHELAHMWIPMIVSTNERRFGWLDEGSTTFTENQGKKAYQPGRNHNLPDQLSYIYRARTGTEGEIMRWSDFHYSPMAYMTASYPKPSTILVALRGLLGEETFMQAYRSFIETWAFKHPYPYDFFNTFERVAGRDLDWFWQSWYFQTWTLDQAVKSVVSTSNRTEIVVEDKGQVPMPVRLEITLQDGSEFTREIPVETWLTGVTETTIEIETEQPVTQIRIDPDMEFPDVDRSNNVWKQ